MSKPMDRGLDLACLKCWQWAVWSCRGRPSATATNAAAVPGPTEQWRGGSVKCVCPLWSLVTHDPIRSILNHLEPKSLIKAKGYSREVKRHVFEWPEALLVLPKRNLNGFRWVNWPMAILQQPHWAATGMTLKLGSLAEQWHTIISPYIPL